MSPSPNVAAVIAFVQPEEGGIADVGDGMGVTYFGQTTAWLARYGLPVPTTLEQAADNWARWMAATGLAAIADVDLTLGIALTDFAINTTVEFATRRLQMILGVTVDGAPGPKTCAAVTFLSPVRRAAVATRLVAARDRAYATTLRSQASWKFSAGWFNRAGDVTDEIATDLEAL